MCAPDLHAGRSGMSDSYIRDRGTRGTLEAIYLSSLSWSDGSTPGLSLRSSDHAVGRPLTLLCTGQSRLFGVVLDGTNAHLEGLVRLLVPEYIEYDWNTTYFEHICSYSCRLVRIREICHIL